MDDRGVDVDTEGDLRRVVRAGRRRRLLRRAGTGLAALGLVVVGGLGYGVLFGAPTVEEVSEPRARTEAGPEAGDEQRAPGPGAPQGRELAMGEPVTVGGLSATVVEAGFRADFPAVQTGGADVLRAVVRVENVSEEPRDVSLFPWRLQTPNGELLDAVGHGAGDALRETRLAPGGHVSGSIVFHVADRRGRFFVLFQPRGTEDAERGVWPTTIGDVSDCEPYVECPKASWLIERLGTAGFRVIGDTGAALTARGNGATFNAWTTDGPVELPQDAGYERVGEVAGVEVLGDGTRLTWMAQRGRVWVASGGGGEDPDPRPPDDVTLEPIRRFVRVTSGR